MTRYLGPGRLISLGGRGGSLYEEGRQKESKPVNYHIYKYDHKTEFTLKHALKRFYARKLYFTHLTGVKARSFFGSGRFKIIFLNI